MSVSNTPDMVRPRIAVRDASIADAPDVARFMTTLGYPTTAEEMQARLVRITATGDYVSLVALKEQVVVGFLGLTFAWYYERTGLYARIVALSVAPEAQGMGVGTSLMDAAEASARNKGAIACIVSSGVRRVEAHRFYERRGFEARGKTFYKSLPKE